jgi:hypothetical protein
LFSPASQTEEKRKKNKLRKNIFGDSFVSSSVNDGSSDGSDLSDSFLQDYEDIKIQMGETDAGEPTAK